YVDDIFFTSNDSLESIDQMLDEANNFHPNIKLVQQIGRSVPFLDVLIQNSNGVLKTSVYHKEAAEPYVVPLGSDHPGHVFRNTVDTAITRAVRYSTTLSEFEEEIRQMKLMFLYNGYPPRHIHRRLITLFSKYLSKYFILHMLHNSDDFDYLRHQLLTASTATAYDKKATIRASVTHTAINEKQTSTGYLLRTRQEKYMHYCDSSFLTTHILKNYADVNKDNSIKSGPRNSPLIRKHPTQAMRKE
ncbi:unnamed protein product, partial [Rotaria magnacalcarata]